MSKLYGVDMEIFSLISARVIPVISTIFCLLVAPRTMLILRLGRASLSASSAISASFAAPSTGGAVRRAFRLLASSPCRLASRSSHSSIFLLLRGMTRTEMSTLLPARW